MEKYKELFDILAKARGINADGHSSYYAGSYQKNIYPREMAERHIRMFCKGGGKELYPQDNKKEKAACIYSSSMLSYNFFHWIDDEHPLTFDGIRYTKVVFEEQFRVLRSRNNKANLDVVLVSEDKNERTILLLESKFTEHFENKPTQIAEAYFDDNNGYFANGTKWAGVMKSLQDKMITENDTYFEGLKQVACHLMGITNVIRSEQARVWFNNNSWLRDQFGITLRGDENFIFKSIVFHPATVNEGRKSEDYEKKNREFISSIKSRDFLPCNLSVNNPIITYRNLWNGGMKASVQNPGLGSYLERYLEAHV